MNHYQEIGNPSSIIKRPCRGRAKKIKKAMEKELRLQNNSNADDNTVGSFKTIAVNKPENKPERLQTEKSYAQAVNIQKSLAQKRTATIPSVTAMNPMFPYTQNRDPFLAPYPEDFTADVTLPGHSMQQRVVPPNTKPWSGKAQMQRGGKKKNFPPRPNANIVPAAGSSNRSQFQAPHQDEPEDLSDDLAPNMARQNVQPGSQAVTAENKLNFKFQRPAPKNQDWAEYQNKFRRVGGTSPEELDVPEIKQEQDQSINNGSLGTNAVETSSAGSSQPSQPVRVLKVELLQGKVGEKPKPIKKPMKSIEVRCKQTPMHNAPKSKNFNLINFVAPFENYPKGIPKSFLMQEMRNNEPVQQIPMQVPVHHPTDPGSQPEYQMEIPYIDLPSWILPGQGPQMPQSEHQAYADWGSNMANPPMFVQMESAPERAYSPSDVYTELGKLDEEPREGSESPDLLQSNQKRLSAFQRLGPLTKPKKPKLTINLMLNKEQAVREVVDETDVDLRYVPVHLRRDIIESNDETVKKYLPFWPWKKNVLLRKTVSARFSKSVMILEQEQMETAYEKDSIFIHISVKGYPKTWNKEDVLDAVLECVKGKSFIPSFIEFNAQECKFLVIRCREALIIIHKVGFCIRKDDVELTVSISLTDTSLNQIDLIPRLVLRKRLMMQYDGEKTLDLKGFFCEKDVSHFVYFPLNRATNQVELIQLQSAVAWEYLTELNLSHNRLTSLDGFNLRATTPRLKILDLSYNYLEKLAMLVSLRELPLHALKLEGNPLCHDYIEDARYVRVMRMLFSGLRELDGVKITLKGDPPPMKRNYCPEEAMPIVEKFLETFFPLLEAPYDDKAAIEDLYDKDAVMTITFRYKLRYSTSYRYFRNLFLRARIFEEGEMESIKGAHAIGTLITKWPAIEHDRYTFTVDTVHHDDATTILRIGGVLKLTAETLAEDEHLLMFTRNIVLHTRNGVEYKIYNEMLYYDVPGEEVMKTAFNITTVRPKQPSLKLESPPDEDLKSKLVDIFVKLADIDKKRGARCLELKNWDLRSALEYYITLLKLDDLTVLSAPKEVAKSRVP